MRRSQQIHFLSEYIWSFRVPSSQSVSEASTTVSTKIHLIRKSAMDDCTRSDFFHSSAAPYLARVSKKFGNQIWQYLDISDVLSISVASRDSAGLMISVENIQRFLAANEKVRTIGNYRLSFSTDTTLGILRRMLHRVIHGTDGVLSIEGSTGRIILDIGSAFKDRDTYMASMVTAVPLEEGDDEPMQTSYGDEPILRALEHASFDEYDDYNPRHPQMGKTHRRGGSYFNSDIGSDMGDIAMSGLKEFDLSNLSTLAVTSLEGMGADSIPFSNSEKLEKLRMRVSEK